MSDQSNKTSFITRRPIVSGILISLLISAIAIGAFFLVKMLFSGSNRGELITPPNGMKLAVQSYLAPSNIILRGISVRAYPNEGYYITADVENTQATPTYSRKNTWHFIAQKAQSSNGDYWQIKSANKNRLRILGVKPEN